MGKKEQKPSTETITIGHRGRRVVSVSSLLRTTSIELKIAVQIARRLSFPRKTAMHGVEVLDTSADEVKCLEAGVNC